MTLLEVRDLSVEFATARGPVAAVRGVSIELAPGEAAALVGESGSGKSALLLALAGLLPRSARTGGSARFKGRELGSLSARQRRALGAAEIGMVFQDPLSALHPLMTVGTQLAEILAVHRGTRGRAARDLAARALGEVGIPAPEARLNALPHELSGGMRQRVVIAMALLLRPALLLADEPTTALDATVQAQVIELLAELARRHGTAVLLVSHDLGIVARFAGRVHVMYAGMLVESAPASELLARPLHPYSAGLLASVARLDLPTAARLTPIRGEPPEPGRSTAGCAFEPRCDLAQARCRIERPALAGLGKTRSSACHFAADLAASQPRSSELEPARIVGVLS